MLTDKGKVCQIFFKIFSGSRGYPVQSSRCRGASGDRRVEATAGDPTAAVGARDDNPADGEGVPSVRGIGGATESEGQGGVMFIASVQTVTFSKINKNMK